ncbi:hypothetical protein EST38_g12868 [Candolleomyces aberdarensis]|uniref:NADH dehydrogenase [ubiquinone] iron-sulfur protein 5 n=1 Tax=Candolleomyces aberdarensis TaxID=2316362 RepID=A0A4Q2D1C1_9AGAR|nr:hypothetical protein EST38_g12868 [Candolleomyces aberdarensis]
MALVWRSVFLVNLRKQANSPHVILHFISGQPRCFAYWQEFQKCYAKTDSPKECTLPANDYLECLHHPKEMARAAIVQQEYARQVEKASKENKKTADAVADSVTVGVGLIQRQGSEDSKSS